MNNHDDDVEPQRPGDDITRDSFSEARHKSSHCQFCDGGGWATIFHTNYTGEPVVAVFDAREGHTKRVMRTVAYCVCAAGRYLLFSHADKAKDVHKIVPDLNDLLHRRDCEWQTNDPTLEGLSITQESHLPPRLRARLRMFREQTS